MAINIWQVKKQYEEIYENNSEKKSSLRGKEGSMMKKRIRIYKRRIHTNYAYQQRKFRKSELQKIRTRNKEQNEVKYKRSVSKE
jgi:hypothetical protein